MDTEQYMELLKRVILRDAAKMTKEPSGVLRHPYIVPCSADSPYYTDTLWDWDSWLTSVMLGQAEADLQEEGKFRAYERGCVLNFLDLCGPDGLMPICVTPEGSLTLNLKDRDAQDTNMHKPVLAQHAAALCQREGGDAEWIRPYFGRLEAFLGRYDRVQRDAETGLYFWLDDFAVGVDNDPSVFFRPKKSCGSIFLNSLMVRELFAMGYLAEHLGDAEGAAGWRGKAQALCESVNRYCWDERDGTYYSVDFALQPVRADSWLHSGAPRNYPCLLLRADSWSSFMPLWAGIASAAQAERMAARLGDERTFACRAGVRSLSRLEKMYDLRATNNPSNWRGPVWGVSNYLIFSGLVKYGMDADAKALAEKTVRLFGRDLEVNGCLHEYYHPDTGMPLMTHGFQNWNYLVLNMIAWLENRRFLDTF